MSLRDEIYEQPEVLERMVRTQNEAAREIFGAPDAVLAWGPISKTARAVETDGGFMLSGDWSYTSGLRNATWLGAHCPQDVFRPLEVSIGVAISEDGERDPVP